MSRHANCYPRHDTTGPDETTTSYTEGPHGQIGVWVQVFYPLPFTLFHGSSSNCWTQLLAKMSQNPNGAYGYYVSDIQAAVKHFYKYAESRDVDVYPATSPKGYYQPVPDEHEGLGPHWQNPISLHRNYWITRSSYLNIKTETCTDTTIFQVYIPSVGKTCMPQIPTYPTPNVGDLKEATSLLVHGPVLQHSPTEMFTKMDLYDSFHQNTIFKNGENLVYNPIKNGGTRYLGHFINQYSDFQETPTVPATGDVNDPPRVKIYEGSPFLSTQGTKHQRTD
ncbi:unnamed protein product [Prorocentrum cordatum]|uniref:Phospholipase B-like n=1 Tax=Prorocentrum cordatum TaxID=2364126 RepID=A0ABN9R6U9_9DINO|nr:unnamed protein product [Polarella glacialis]